MIVGAATWLSLVGTPFLVGWALLRWVGLRWADDRLAYLPWTYAAGTLVVALLLFLWSWLALPLDARLFVPLLLGIALILGATASPSPPAPTSMPVRRNAVGTGVLAASLLIVLAVSADRFVLSTAQLMVETDEAAIWAAKAETLYASGGFTAAFRDATGPDARPFLHHADYPPFNPLLQVWTFMHRGRIVHLENRFLVQLYFPAMLLLLAAALRRVVRDEVAALLVLAVAATPMARMLTMFAYADHMVALGWLIALDAWLRYRTHRDPRWWRLALIGVTFASWSKNEGTMLALTALLAAAIAVVITLVTDRGGEGWARALERNGLPNRGRDLAWCLLPLGAGVAHLASTLSLGFRNDLFAGGVGSFAALALAQVGERVPVLAAFAAHSALQSPLSISLLPVAFLLLAALFPVRLVASTLRVPALALGIALVALHLAYLGSYHPVLWHLDTSYSRVVYQLVPALALWIAAFAAEIWPSVGVADRASQLPRDFSTR